MARISPAGVLLYCATNINFDMWSLPLDVDEAKVTGKPEQLTRNGGFGRESFLTPDGTKLAYERQLDDPGDTEIWVYDLETRKAATVVTGPVHPHLNKITAKGESLVYSRFENQRNTVYRVATGGATPQKLCEDCCLFDLSSEETRILSCLGSGPYAKRPVGWLDLASGTQVPLMAAGTFSRSDFKLSPDDKWIAFGKETSGEERAQLCVAPVRPGKLVTAQDWIPITDGKFVDTRPRWSPNGKLLYFISERDGDPCVWARRFDPVGGRAVGEAFGVYHFHTPSLRISFSAMSFGKDRVVFPIADTRSNIWMLKLP
jgi:Tol biopolymer transport system component